ncbi:MAG: pyridoxamine 5'-phosphate oxidase family protein [Candidatus Dojkabacteria bacterium]|jgi:predicted pyridoxine 5'-phosphate oxidase superfamily flavin-nucleotide-binding protein|nr:pyridoxamine 5'-phosphate oxidase family protein [Candidatus Dojkabacteria bacterium]
MKIKITREQKALLEKSIISLSTSSIRCRPNLVAVSCVKVVAADKILITDNFFGKTRKNLLENASVSLAVWSPKGAKGWQFKGVAKYYSRGRWKRLVDEMKENKGLAHKAAVVVTVKEVYNLANPGK